MTNQSRSYLPYAGIGSRSTPTGIISIMRYLGSHLYQEGWTLRSGGATGADTAFEDGVNAVHKSGSPDLRKEIYLPWAGFNNNPSQLYPRNLPFSDDEIGISANYHPAWHRCSPAAKIMMQRNLRQIVGHPNVCGEAVQTSKFVICWTPGGRLEGGTSQALRIAKVLSIPIFNLGLATSATELERMIQDLDTLQNKLKKEAIDGDPLAQGEQSQGAQAGHPAPAGSH